MSKKYETSEDIVAGIDKGDKTAETAMIEKYSSQLLYFLKKRTGDPEKAMDLLQETFVIVLQKLRKEPLSDTSTLAAYLHQTAKYIDIGEIRKDGRRKTAPDSDFIETMISNDDDPYDTVRKDQAIKAIREQIDSMANERDRKILSLYYVKDYEKDYICQLLEIDFRHFDKVISRARLRFAKLIANNRPDLAQNPVLDPETSE